MRFFILIFSIYVSVYADFWKSKADCIGPIKFSVTTHYKEYVAENIPVPTEEGKKEFCTFISTKDLFYSENYTQEQWFLEFGYFVLIFMEEYFPQIVKYGLPPTAVAEVLDTVNTITIYEVKIDDKTVSISSRIVVGELTERGGEKYIDVKELKWQQGPYKVEWNEILHDTLKGKKINEYFLRQVYKFPIFAGEKGEYRTWVRQATEREVGYFTWHKDMFTSFMEAGYFSSFYARYIFPHIQDMVEIPGRYLEEGFILNYLTTLEITGITLQPIAKIAEGDEKWEGNSIKISWEEAIPAEIKGGG